MIRNLSYKKKNRILVVAIFLSIYLVYTFGITRTIEVYQLYSENKAKFEYAHDSPNILFKLKNDINHLNSKLGNDSVTSNSDKLIELVTSYCDNKGILLKEFPRLSSALNNELLIETNVFTVSGGFNDLLELVYILEQKVNLGKVMSVSYKTQKDLKLNRFVLSATVYIQNVKKGIRNENKN